MSRVGPGQANKLLQRGREADRLGEGRGHGGNIFIDGD